MKIFLVKSVGVIIIIIANIFLLLCLAVFVLEKFEIAKKFDGKLSTRDERFSLYKTNYYGEELDGNPYEAFDIKYLHPYFGFSLPFTDEHIRNTNNKFTTLDKDGFRINPFNNKAKSKKIVLLGGSTAFGHYSSSDKTSISAIISKNSSFNVVNRNSPGWNSLQELIALVKYNEKYTHSVSLSLYNDLNTYCDGYKNLKLKDTSARFFYWNNVIENEKYPAINYLNLKDKIKYFLIKNFPETKIIYKKLLTIIKSKNQNSYGNSENYCSNDYEDLIKVFLKNQILMRQISESKGARHILIIQPMYGLHEKTNNLNFFSLNKNNRAKPGAPEKKFQQKTINYLMAHDFCKKDCYNFSKIYDEEKIVTIVNEIKDKKYRGEIFADNTHMTDEGNRLLAEKLLKLESFR